MQQLLDRIVGGSSVDRAVRLTQLSHWSVRGLLILAVWQGVVYWNDVLSPEFAAVDASIRVSEEQARASLFVILGVALATPLLILVGWIIVGLLYKLLCTLVGRVVPWATMLMAPVLLAGALILGHIQRDLLTSTLVDGYRILDEWITGAQQFQVRKKFVRPIPVEP